MGLDQYLDKRDFSKTPEPRGKILPSKTSRFVVQRHQARRLHYDLRLEIGGVLKSWAIPKGPSLNPKDKRLAIHTEDHPLDYLSFEGKIPSGNYGAGRMSIWDNGSFKSSKGYEKDIGTQYEAGNLKIEFFGHKLKGIFALVQTNNQEKDQWLLIKKEDQYATSLDYDAEDFVVEEKKEKGKLDLRQMVKPMLATKVENIFSDPDWLYEIKWDGYRLMANIQNGHVNIYSRNGVSFNQKFPDLHAHLQSIPHDAILDGEVVVLDQEGIPHFQKLQHYDKITDGELRYYIFDLLYLNGHDMTDLPLLDRKSLIEATIEGVPQVYYCDHIIGMGNTFYEKALESGLEGVVAKKSDSTYSPGKRTDNWLKIKSVERQEVIICGYTESDAALFGSLILGFYHGGKLTYCGNCGSGFTDVVQKDLLLQFKPLLREQTPFKKKINLKGRKPVWIEPSLICEVKFAEWTSSGLMRHPVFLGLRSDKAPHEIRKEKSLDHKEEKPVNKSLLNETLEVNGYAVPISNLDKVYWPDSDINKYQLIDYYLAVAEFILPFLKDRPQNLHRHPDGIQKEGFYQKDTAGIFPHWIETIKVFSSSTGKDIEYLLCQHEATLLYMANLGCIEINPWHSRKGSLDRPDYSVIDIDPSNKNSFEEVIEVAQVTRKVLERAGIKGYCKTSGSSGMHIYLPMRAAYTYEEARDFTKLLCYFIHEELPDLTSMERKVDKRKNKVYLDYLQNRRGQTIAAPYCVRPKPGATVSAPLLWEEVKPGLKLQDFNIFTMKKRIENHPKLFTGILKEGLDMQAAIERLET